MNLRQSSVFAALPAALLLLLPACVVAIGNGGRDRSHFSHNGVDYTLPSGSLHILVDSNDVDASVGGHTLRVHDGRMTLDGVDCGSIRPGDNVYLDESGNLYVNGAFRADV